MIAALCLLAFAFGDPAVALPEEFRGPRAPIGAAAGEAAAGVVSPTGPGPVVAIEDHPPAAAAPGDPVADPGAEHPELDGPTTPEFEQLVTLRTATERTPPPRLTFKGEREPPRRTALFSVGYRQFRQQDRLDRLQSWHLVGLELTPLRRFVRLNIVTEFGMEGGEAARGGDRADLMVLQKLGLGAQYPHWVSPYAEFQAGVGAARVELFERNDLALLYTMGVDGGIQIAAARHLFFHAAVGWIRPYFDVKGQVSHADRLTFKVGIGF